MKINSKLIIFLIVICLTMELIIPATAASNAFIDINQQSRYYQSVEYLYKNGITLGVGGGRYDPVSSITIRQWIVMLCRAYKLEDTLQKDAKYNFGDYCITYAFQQEWIDENGLLYPDTRLTYGKIFEIAFNVLDYPIYSSYLYDRENVLSESDNILSIAKTIGLSDINYKSIDIVNRGEAAIILYSVLTKQFGLVLPPIATKINIWCEGNIPEEFLVELYKLPSKVIKTFADEKWVYSIQGDYIYEAEKRDGKNYGGLTSHAKKTIYVDTASSTIHEFGHFLDNVLDFPVLIKLYYDREKEASIAVLRKYSQTTEGEYFADNFVYWVNNKGNNQKMKEIKQVIPQTYHYFELLDQAGWFD